MGNNYNYECPHPVAIPPAKPLIESIKSGIEETLFPDDPFRQFKNQPASRKLILGLQYFVPVLEWAPRYTFEFFKADLIAGITIASLAVPQGISYASLANLPPIIGLYSSFVPPLVYAMLGSSKDLAVGTVAVASLLIASMLGKEVNPNENPKLYLQLALTATFFAGIFQAALGFLRLGFIVDFLSHATIVGFMGGAATVVCLQQLKGIFGLVRFTHETDLVSIGQLKKGLNPPSVSELAFGSPHLMAAVKTGIITGVIALAEGVAVGRSFSMFKNYHIDGNKEMIAFGMMNIAGSCTSCYLTTGCKTAVSNIVMATAVMITLLFLTPLFHYTPLVVLSSIIIAAMLGLIDYEAAIGLWKVDKCDFIVCISAYIGVVFGSVEIGLVIAVAISLLRMLMSVARPRTFLLGNIPNSMIYRSIDQYPIADNVPGVLILQIDAPVYFANANYLRERISRWIYEEEEKLKSTGGSSLQYVILDLSAVGSIDTSGISMLEEVKKNIDRRDLRLVLANPRSEVIKKLEKSKFMESIGREWIYLTVGEAVAACNFMLHTSKSNNPVTDTVEFDAHDNMKQWKDVNSAYRFILMEEAPGANGGDERPRSSSPKG
ncbi:hypothetical protein DKX38_015410 [Salix brachista]|uniref:STAS domain-containing protein n=1 Tax=Salix brachista TaxID=2182728 RepID=A0A5N5L549_9ROSI|nr:hypothetical protein DKX38_015410 [Salix brachista]